MKEMRGALRMYFGLIDTSAIWMYPTTAIFAAAGELPLSGRVTGRNATVAAKGLLRSGRQDGIEIETR